MPVTTPDWLAKHSGTLSAGLNGQSWLILLDNEPQYRLTPVPAGGKFSCQVIQTVNGRRLDKGTTFPTPADAVQGGLDDLRQTLGW